MMKYKLVLVPFPFDDLSSTKLRPAVCLTEPIGPHHHIVLAFITSRVSTDPLSTDLVIFESDPDFAATGLRVASTVQLHRMLTVTTLLIQRVLGTLPSQVHAQIDERLKALFQLT